MPTSLSAPQQPSRCRILAEYRFWKEHAHYCSSHYLHWHYYSPLHFRHKSCPNLLQLCSCLGKYINILTLIREFTYLKVTFGKEIICVKGSSVYVIAASKKKLFFLKLSLCGLPTPHPQLTKIIAENVNIMSAPLNTWESCYSLIYQKLSYWFLLYCMP